MSYRRLPAQFAVRHPVLHNGDQHLHDTPMPMPSTSMQAASCRVEEPTPISESRRMPRVITAEPAMTPAAAKSRSALAITSRGNSGSRPSSGSVQAGAGHGLVEVAAPEDTALQRYEPVSAGGPPSPRLPGRAPGSAGCRPDTAPAQRERRRKADSGPLAIPLRLKIAPSPAGSRPSMQPCGKHRCSRTLALEDRRADGGGQPDSRDDGQEHVLGDGGEDLVRHAEHDP